jgi:hypothetical protein
MGAEDLIFRHYNGASYDDIYDPQTVEGTDVTIQVTNSGDDTLSSLGLYLAVASTLGDVDNPGEGSPETDYQDLITMGQDTTDGVTSQGGVYVSVPQTTGPNIDGYINRTTGYSYATKIAFKELGPGDAATFTIRMEQPTGAPARRFYVNVVVE